MTDIQLIKELSKKHPQISKFLINFAEKGFPFEVLKSTFYKIINNKDILRNNSFDISKYYNLELLDDDITSIVLKSKSESLYNKMLSNKHKDKIGFSTRKSIIEFLETLINSQVDRHTIQHDVTEKISNIPSDGFEEVFLERLEKYTESKTMSSPENIINCIQDFNINIVERSEKILIIAINDYKAMQHIGSSSWCIATSDHYFNEYKNKRCSSKNTSVRGVTCSDQVIRNRYWIVFNFNYEISNPNRMVCLTIGSSCNIIESKNMRDHSLNSEDYNLIKPLVTKDKLYTEYIHYLRNHISSKNIDILTLATEFNEDYFHHLINVLTIDKIKPEFLKVFKNINSELFTKLSKTIDFSNLPKVYRNHTIIGKLLSQKDFINFDSNTIKTIFTQYEILDIGAIIENYTLSGRSNSYSIKEQYSEARDNIYNNIKYVKKYCGFNSTAQYTHVFKKLSTLYPEIVKDSCKYNDSSDLFSLVSKKTNLLTIIKLFKNDTNILKYLNETIYKYPRLIKELRQNINYSGFVKEFSTLPYEKQLYIYSLNIFKKTLSYEWFSNTKLFKNIYNYQEELINSKDDNEFIDKLIKHNLNTDINITSEKLSLKFIKLYLRNKLVQESFDQKPFPFVQSFKEFLDFICSLNITDMTKLFKSTLFNCHINQNIIKQLYQSQHEDKRIKTLTTAFIKAESTQYQAMFNQGYLKQSEDILKYLKSKNMNFNKLMANSNDPQLKSLAEFIS
jgi:hypothetical protein